jgi:hypothetical protein
VESRDRKGVADATPEAFGPGKGNTVFGSIKNYLIENPNAFQIASTFVIGVMAFAIWGFISKKPPQK